MIKQTRMAVAVSLALANLPLAVFAAETTTANEDELVVTATGFSQERREAPATISVVNEKELNTRSNQNATEALREMPGVLVVTVTAAWQRAMSRCAGWIPPIPRTW